MSAVVPGGGAAGRSLQARQTALPFAMCRLALSSQDDPPVRDRVQILPRTPHTFRNLFSGELPRVESPVSAGMDRSSARAARTRNRPNRAAGDPAGLPTRR